MPTISVNQAREFIQRYSDNKAVILKAGVDPDILAMSETFERSDIDQILNQQGCVSFRIYYGMSTDLKIHAIMVGVDNQENDILAAAGPVIKEEGIRCPPYCKVNAGLNDQ